MPHELFNLAGKYIIDFTDISFKTFFEKKFLLFKTKKNF